MKLGDICTIKTGLVLSRKKADAYSEVQIPYRVISLKSFNNSIALDRSVSEEFITDKEITSSYISQVGDVIVRLRAPVKAVCIDEDSKDMIVSSLMCILRLRDDVTVDSRYLAYYLNSKEVQYVLSRSIKGTTIPMIKTVDLKNIDVVIPSLKKQNSIVSFLQLAEKEVALLEKLKEKKEKLSKNILDIMIEQTKEKIDA